MVLLRLGTADVGAWLGLGLAGIFYNMFQQFLARRSSHPGAELVLELLGVEWVEELGVSYASVHSSVHSNMLAKSSAPIMFQFYENVAEYLARERFI